MWGSCRTTDMLVVAEQARMESIEQTPRIAQLEGDWHEVKDKFYFSDRCNNISDLQYSMISDECDFVKRQHANDKVSSEEMV